MFRKPPSSFSAEPSTKLPPAEIKVPAAIGSLIRSLTGVDPAEVMLLIHNIGEQAALAVRLLSDIHREVMSQRNELASLREIVRASVPEAHIALSEMEREIALAEPSTREIGEREIARLALATGQIGGLAYDPEGPHV